MTWGVIVVIVAGVRCRSCGFLPDQNDTLLHCKCWTMCLSSRGKRQWDASVIQKKMKHRKPIETNQKHHQEITKSKVFVSDYCKCISWDVSGFVKYYFVGLYVHVVVVKLCREITITYKILLLNVFNPSLPLLAKSPECAQLTHLTDWLYIL